MKGPCLPAGYQMKWPMPNEPNSSPLFQCVRNWTLPPASFRQILRPMACAYSGVRWIAEAAEAGVAANDAARRRAVIMNPF